MNTHLLALELMAFQGCLGAFDTLYHHEFTEQLARRYTAQKELRIHSIRALIYSFLFIGLSSWKWNGVFTVILFVIFAIEVFLTLWDFVIEDQTRLLPATERVTHTILAINGGAFIILLAINAPEWWQQPSAMEWHPYGFLSVFLALCGIGVGISGIRDAIASLNLKKMSKKKVMPIQFSDVSQHILITGATGFIGQVLVNYLVCNHQNITVVTRRPKHAAWLFNGRVKCINTIHDLPRSVKVDIIINLAGARILGWPWTKSRRTVLLKSRIEATQSIIAWIEHAFHKPHLLLSASAIGYYGIQALDDSSRLTEKSHPQSIFMSELCQQWEDTAKQAVRYGTYVAIMRFGLVLGQQGGALPMLLQPIYLGLGGRLGTGKQWMSWIHIDDLVRAIAHIWNISEQHILKLRTENNGLAHATKKQLFEVYNFTAPESVSQYEFSLTAAKLLHRPCCFNIPSVMVKRLLGEQSDLLLEGQNVFPEKLTESGFKFIYPDIKKALYDLMQ